MLHGEMMKLLDQPVQMALSNCILNSDPIHDDGEGVVGRDCIILFGVRFYISLLELVLWGVFDIVFLDI